MVVVLSRAQSRCILDHVGEAHPYLPSNPDVGLCLQFSCYRIVFKRTSSRSTSGEPARIMRDVIPQDVTGRVPDVTAGTQHSCPRLGADHRMEALAAASHTTRLSKDRPAAHRGLS